MIPILKYMLLYGSILLPKKIEYSIGDLIEVKNCRIQEFNGKKQICTIDRNQKRSR